MQSDVRAIHHSNNNNKKNTFLTVAFSFFG